MTLQLLKPSQSHLKSIEEYKTIFMAQKESLDGASFLSDFDDLSQWLSFVKQLENKETAPFHLVPAIAYVLVDNTTNKVVGMSDLRLNLENDYLAKFGGHIGYSIHPDYRLKGYGKYLLSEMLKQAKALDFKEVMVTCDEDNIGSMKIIEVNGGVFKQHVIDDNGVKVRQYWITL